MSVPPKAQAPRSVDRAFILVWGVEFIAYTLDITLWGIDSGEHYQSALEKHSECVGQVLVLQYFRKYSKKDPILIQAVVAVLLFFITIHTLFLAMNNYKDYILLFGDFEGQDVIL
ncbi:hypothetical protein B0H14DRAFT_3455968 [Mycena olivaceomarginata]|nr:hypothetical protein B0H14DRAFT_3455968 [Mycena olivaceomarginata]